MSKNFHFSAAVIQFLCMSVGYMIDSPFLFYWATFWTGYEVFKFFTTSDVKEEEKNAVR